MKKQILWTSFAAAAAAVLMTGQVLADDNLPLGVVYTKAARLVFELLFCNHWSDAHGHAHILLLDGRGSCWCRRQRWRRRRRRWWRVSLGHISHRHAEFGRAPEPAVEATGAKARLEESATSST